MSNLSSENAALSAVFKVLNEIQMSYLEHTNVNISTFRFFSRDNRRFSPLVFVCSALF